MQFCIVKAGSFSNFYIECEPIIVTSCMIVLLVLHSPVCEDVFEYAILANKCVSRINCCYTPLLSFSLCVLEHTASVLTLKTS